MLQTIIDKLQFWWTHEHELECYGHDMTVTPSSERWYWHLHKCWCGKAWSVLTVDCKLPEAQENMK